MKICLRKIIRCVLFSLTNEIEKNKFVLRNTVLIFHFNFPVHIEYQDFEAIKRAPAKRNPLSLWILFNRKTFYGASYSPYSKSHRNDRNLGLESKGVLKSRTVWKLIEMKCIVAKLARLCRMQVPSGVSFGVFVWSSCINSWLLWKRNKIYLHSVPSSWRNFLN